MKLDYIYSYTQGAVVLLAPAGLGSGVGAGPAGWRWGHRKYTGKLFVIHLARALEDRKMPGDNHDAVLLSVPQGF
jgi:hypothetical protein